MEFLCVVFVGHPLHYPHCSPWAGPNMWVRETWLEWEGPDCSPGLCWPSAVTRACPWTSHTSASVVAEWSWKCLTSLSHHLAASKPAVWLWMWEAGQAHKIVSLVPGWSPLCPTIGLQSGKWQRKLWIPLWCCDLWQTPNKNRWLFRFITLDFKRQNWISREKKKPDTKKGPLYLQQNMATHTHTHTQIPGFFLTSSLYYMHVVKKFKNPKIKQNKGAMKRKVPSYLWLVLLPRHSHSSRFLCTCVEMFMHKYTEKCVCTRERPAFWGVLLPLFLGPVPHFQICSV